MTSLRDVLRQTYARNGEVSERILVDEARPKNAPLHDRFEWNNRIAGDAYRLVQAGNMIRSVQVDFISPATGEPTKVREWVSVHEMRPTADPDETVGRYIPIGEVMADEVAASTLIRIAERELAEWRRKYRHLVEYRDLIQRVLGEEAS
jgi:hypothetical protein